MKKIQFFFSLYVSKAVCLLLKLMGRNASCFPGEVAIKLCGDFLSQIKAPETVIAVTGTNGKTTVSNLITSILRQNGYTVTNNSFGSNIQPGVASALIKDTTLLGRPKCDIAVLEVDERSSLRVYPYLHPDYLICNNIMRDSIKRNANTDFISFIISSALPETTKVILNGDDLICSSLAPQCRERIYFGIAAERPEVSAVPFINDIVYCPECGETLEADYLRYNHIGRLHCPSCGFKSPDRDFTVTDIDREGNTVTVKNHSETRSYKMINDNIVNIYNLCGAVALLQTLGLSGEALAASLDKAEIVKTRLETVCSGDLKITKIMAKGQNPIACARCFDYVAECPGKNKSLVIIIDDYEDNINNSESTCWLYDCDYSYLDNDSVGEIIFGGPRCKDQYLRAILAGVAPEKIKCTEDSATAAENVDTEKCKDIYILHELYRVKDSECCMDILVKKGERA